MGDYRRDVGRTRFEYARRGVAGAADPGWEAIFPKEFRRRCEDRMEPGFLRLQLATAADLFEVGDGIFCDSEAIVGARIHHLSLQTLLVAGTRWQPAADLFSA